MTRWFSLFLSLSLLGTACGGEKPVDTGGDPYVPVDDDGDGWAAQDDCDDMNAAVHPDADEICDGDDNDCDGQVDEDIGEVLYADADGDGHGDAANSITACPPVAGYVGGPADDCDDSDSDIHPGVTDGCDGVDNDCDDQVDEDASSASWYQDGDHDGYGDAAAVQTACAQPTGFVANDEDCDDTDSAISPAGTETCDGADNDCDGSVDEADAVGAASWHPDDDGDGYGGSGTTVACQAPTGWVSNQEDCDDGDPAISPGATEVCDARDVDEDCDGLADDDDASVSASGQSIWYPDTDRDSYGDASSRGVNACDNPGGYVAEHSDCDDTSASTYPGARETCNSVDDDCDGSVDEGAVDTSTWYTDADGDGYGDPAATTTACTQPSGTVSNARDCDDSASGVNPGANEVCDSRDVDEDCDGVSDDHDSSTLSASKSTWYPDADGDTYGASSATGTAACEAPTGYVSDHSDCDDSHSVNHPSASEYCDGADNDCDGSVDEGALDADTWYDDDDGDGYGDASDTSTACTRPTGYTDNDEDCDDTDASLTLECWDTGVEVPFWDGAYTGPMDVDVRVPSLGITDTCSGTLTVTVTEASTPQMRGSCTCSWGGLLAGMLGDQTGRIDGNITSDPDVEGNVLVGSAITDTWTGGFTDDVTLEGEFSGSTSISGFPVTYTGLFVLVR